MAPASTISSLSSFTHPMHAPTPRAGLATPFPPDFAMGLPPPEARMQLYAVHDTTLVPLLLALDVFDNKWPDFCAALAFELYQASMCCIESIRCELMRRIYHY